MENVDFDAIPKAVAVSKSAIAILLSSLGKTGMMSPQREVCKLLKKGGFRDAQE